jgi:hypothetical protein
VVAWVRPPKAAELHNAGIYKTWKSFESSSAKSKLSGGS